MDQFQLLKANPLLLFFAYAGKVGDARVSPLQLVPNYMYKQIKYHFISLHIYIYMSKYKLNLMFILVKFELENKL